MTEPKLSYASKMMADAVALIVDATEGGRHSAIISAAGKVADYVADGSLNREAVVADLLAAAVNKEKPANEALRCIEYGLGKGKAEDAWYPTPGGAPRKLSGRWKDRVYHISQSPRVSDMAAMPTVPMADQKVRATLFQSTKLTQGDAAVFTWKDIEEHVAGPAEWPSSGKDGLPMWTFAELEDDNRAKRPDGLDASGKEKERMCGVSFVHLLALDYDDDPSWSLDRVREWWGDVCYIAHTSASNGLPKKLKSGGSKPAMPRGRVLIALSRPVTEAEYELIAAWTLTCGRGEAGQQELANARRCFFVPAAAAGYAFEANLVDRALDVDVILAIESKAQEENTESDAERFPEPEVWDLLDRRMDREKIERAQRHLVNVCRILRTDTRWAGRLAYCEFSDRLLVDGRGVRDQDIPVLAEWMGAVYGIHASSELIRDAVLRVASEQTFHPVREYLESLQWDGVSRLSHVLWKGFGVADTPDNLTQVLGRRWAISCVARIMTPGCKVDTVLILFGEQGALKSSAFRALIGDDWFSDSHLDLGDMVRAYMGIRGKWVYELAELDALRARESTTIKSFLSSQADSYIRKHGRMSETHPRQTVFVGTTNLEDMLKDPTGSRRFWVRKATLPINLDWLRENRDQLWAEAVALFDAGEQWWLTAAEEDARRAGEWEHTDEDVWTQAIYTWLVGKDIVTAGEIALGALKLDVGNIDGRVKNRIYSVLRTAGWRSERSRGYGDRTPRWRRP